MNALELADILDRSVLALSADAAVELRRLHAELEAMTQCAKNHDAYRTKYLLLNQELLEALKWIAHHDLSDTDLMLAGHMAHGFIGAAIAAINKAEGRA